MIEVANLAILWINSDSVFDEDSLIKSCNYSVVRFSIISCKVINLVCNLKAAYDLYEVGSLIIIIMRIFNLRKIE